MVSKDRKLIFHLLIAILLLISGVSWCLYSMYQVNSFDVEPDWFARSGAVLVLCSIFAGMVTKPQIESASITNFLNTYNHVLEREELEEVHWCVKYGIVKKLVILEFLLGIVGTLVWAYGDTWLS